MPGVVISKSLLVPPIVISPAYDKSDAVALAILYVVLSVGIVTLVAPINTMVGDVLSIIMLVLVSPKFVAVNVLLVLLSSLYAVMVNPRLVVSASDEFTT